MFYTGKKYKRYIAFSLELHEGISFEKDSISLAPLKDFCEKHTTSYICYEIFDCETRELVFETHFNNIVERK